ncbi:pepsin/retropepsin-like aspartic protease family protein [Pedobacter sp. Hv1]|uniref:pepsin/retropepsin-like aspartic protease family protein n=1 Tax=Pedobacter sp. Hv1 TaxID=1740090 RepID=UPI0006D8D6E1|nr:pepsin/retropepsin-like aspartic protease family protein [Pedobacter sp. Hv1]KQC01751.1 hypothetical protein AQF98_05110 [Pedobacter sp. Hv1]
MKIKPIVLLALCVLIAQQLTAQQPLPILKTNSNVVSIRDGKNYRKNTWKLTPQAKLDIYYTGLPQKEGKVTFISDIDSISFNVKYGKTYDFIVLLNNKDTCYTRISANYDGINSPIKIKKQTNSSDTIPFTLHNSRIYLNGQVNGKKNLSFQLDLGAGATCINYKSVAKAGIKFDGKTLVTNSHGTNEEPTSNKNAISIAGLRWEDVPMVQVKNMNNDEDVIIGNSLFADKIIELNYDLKILIVHDQLPNITNGYTKHDVIFEQHRPSIQATIHVNGKDYTDWFLFDTGRAGTMVIGKSFVTKFGLWDKFKTILSLGDKKIVVIPKTTIGKLSFTDIVTNAQSPKSNSERPTLLGNELLNHFNVVLDNVNGIIYLKPNSLQKKNYADLNELKATALYLFIGTLLLIAALVICIRKWVKYWKASKTKK